MLNASQAVFARFLGVRPTTVRAWECGNNVPSDMAARFLDEIRANPSLFKARMVQVIKPKTPPGNRRPKGKRRAPAKAGR
jgi:DNA-binding XRE family transcriptional regulator